VSPECSTSESIQHETIHVALEAPCVDCDAVTLNGTIHPICLSFCERASASMLRWRHADFRYALSLSLSLSAPEAGISDVESTGVDGALHLLSTGAAQRTPLFVLTTRWNGNSLMEIPPSQAASSAGRSLCHRASGPTRSAPAPLGKSFYRRRIRRWQLLPFWRAGSQRFTPAAASPALHQARARISERVSLVQFSGRIGAIFALLKSGSIRQWKGRDYRGAR
jgi:hypothetical protein